MESERDNQKESIDINNFFNISSSISSDFFNNLFKDSIKNIIINKEKDDPIYLFVNIKI